MESFLSGARQGFTLHILALSLEKCFAELRDLSLLILLHALKRLDYFQWTVFFAVNSILLLIFSASYIFIDPDYFHMIVGASGAFYMESNLTLPFRTLHTSPILCFTNETGQLVALRIDVVNP